MITIRHDKTPLILTKLPSKVNYTYKDINTSYLTYKRVVNKNVNQ